MEKQPFDPEDKDRSIPEQEQLHPGEIDLTGVVRQDDDLRDVIGDAIVEAQSKGGNLPEWGVRAIARSLANAQESSATALHHFAVTGKIDLPAVASELDDLRVSNDREIQELVRLLASHLTGTHTAPSNAPGPELGPRPDAPQVAQGLREHGDAFRAYLQLADAELHHPELLARFRDFYLGSFASMHELLYALTDARKGMEAVNKAAEDWGLDGFIALDEGALAEAARAAWDIVEIGGTHYVFMK